jgi:hypothetical protein
MAVHESGCLCGAVRYLTQNEPVRVTICHCKFCQRAADAAYMVEPIFREAVLQVTQGSPAVYEHCSGDSGKIIHIHFFAACGTKLYLSFERFAKICGVYAGTFDDPNWFEIRLENSKHIFIDMARHETILPPSIPYFSEHALRNDGTPLEPVVLDRPQIVGSRPA